MKLDEKDYLMSTLWPYLTFIVGALVRAASAGTKSRVLVLFGYAQTALNADATFEFCPPLYDKAYCQLNYLCLS